MLVQEVGYLAQRFYAMDDFEVYHSDLDDESCVFHMFWATRFTNKEPPISQIKSHPFHGFGSPISRK